MNMKLGYSRTSITPDYSVPLAGYGNTSFRKSTENLDEIYTTAIALSDGANTVIFIENDLATSAKPVTDPTRARISKMTGVPVENIMVAAVHLHSAPDQWNTDEPSIVRYNAELIDAMVTNAVAAFQDMSPVTAEAGSAQVEDLNYVRHYILADGHVRGPAFGLQYNSPKVAHTHDSDKQMQVVRFAREGKQDVLLVNWQAHPQIAAGSGTTEITADTIGAMRDYLENKMLCKVFYVLGACGDVQAVSLIKGETRYTDYVEHGKVLGQAVESILRQNMTPLTLGRVKSLKWVYTAQINKTELEKEESAKLVLAQWSKDNDYNAAVKAGEPYGINSPYHAMAILQRRERPDTEQIELYAFGIGQMAFAFAPCEMFCENGMYIKAHSPYKHTVISELANSSVGYIPTKEAFDYNCYESNTCRFLRGTGESMAQEYAAMLQQLAEE